MLILLYLLIAGRCSLNPKTLDGYGMNDNDFFRQATMCLCGYLDFGQGMQKLLQYLKSYLPGDLMSLSLYEPKLGGIKETVIATANEVKYPDALWPLSPETRTLMEGKEWPKSRIVNNPVTDPVINNLLPSYKKIMPNFRNTDLSSLLVRLTTEGLRIGTVALVAGGKNRFTQEHLRLFSMLNDPFATAFSNSIKYQEINRLKDLLADDNRHLQRELQRISGDEIIGKDFGLKNVMEMLREVSRLDSSVLILGETGVGKEIIAQTIHNLSDRRNSPYIKINCGAIPPTLIDSELFGHEKGAFTGAIARNRGCFERADKGTIFLDEVAELPLKAQVRLLRVLQEGEITRVGGSKPIKVNNRIIAATHQNLQNLIKEGKFREDLWFRLNVFPIRIPPLRERKEDIPAFVNHFIGKKLMEVRLPAPPTLDKGAIERLMTYSWPGNVRELENVVERSLILSKGKPLTFQDVDGSNDNDKPLSPPTSIDKILELDKVVTKHILQVMKLSKGKINGQGGAAELLSINPGTLRYKLKKLGISFGRLHGKLID